MIRMSKAAMLGAALVGGAMVASNANAAGFEKSVLWGAESAGKAGISAPYIQGSDSIYFNPAGLVANKPGNSLSLNVSPTSAQFEGPINNNNDSMKSETSVTFPFGATYGYSMEDWGFGIGAFVSGGNSVEYKDVNFGPTQQYRPEVKTAIQIVEISAGAAYRVNEDLKLGLAWRVAMAKADFGFITRSQIPSGPLAGQQAIFNTKLTDLKDTQAVAFRFGAQYKVNESTDLALTFRSEVNFDPKGTAGGTVAPINVNATSPMTTADATAHTTFPMMIALAGVHRMEEWDLLAQYDWIQYSRVGELVVDSTTFALTGNQTRLKTDWRDQHTIRLGAEYKTPWPVRFGYIFSTQVTNSDYARPTFSGPGPGHAFTVGTGKAFGGETEADSNFRVDGALEYTFAAGDVGGRAAAGTGGAGNDIRNGTHSSAAYVAHLGLTYMF